MMRVRRCENTMTGQGSVSGGFQQSSGADKAGSDACTGRAAAAEGESAHSNSRRLITGRLHHRRWQRRHCIGRCVCRINK